ncbi:MAG: hydroxylamine oxidoreductase [Planctomycetes bacterium]|nr:hydroxylamine oxidoreductase [Planctomycetota bacterium]
MNSRRAFLATLAIASGVLGTAFADPSSPSVNPLNPHPTATQAIGLPELSPQSRECVDCHKRESMALYQMWGESKHYRANVGCFECHRADKSDPDAKSHYDQTIAVIVSPADCARCHSKEVEEFSGSHHSKAGRILGSLDNVLAEVVEGNMGFVSEGFPEGVSAAAVSGCWQCHGSQVQVLAGGTLDPATWPNTGIGRLNPDGTEGSCAACHTRHSFSAAQARHPDTCGKCHLGPDHPQKEIYEESKHGIAFFANVDKMNLDSAKWIVGEDYWAAPTCATCHMSATKTQGVTHDIGLRISWNNRPVVSTRPELSDAKMGLPGANIPWQTRRESMKDVCINCHNRTWVDNFYIQYDELVELYNEKFAKPGAALYDLTKGLRKPVNFSNKIDFTWFELWHHEGRRARHAASMMGPDYTHWHGTYDLAKNFYTEYIPELEELVHMGMNSGDAAKVQAAEALQAKLDEVLNTPDHRWYLGKMDPAEAEKRAKAAEEFKKRYSK